MKSKKVLALIMGAIVASSGMSQMAVQVYANDEESNSSSYYYYEESNGSSEPMEGSPAVEELSELKYFKNERLQFLVEYKYLKTDLSNVYGSTNNLVFKPTLDNEAELVYFDEGFEFDGDIVVPEKVKINGNVCSVTSIAGGAFARCEKLRKVTLPESITRIGDNAFSSCSNLKLEELPKGITKIGSCAFACCMNLQLEELPKDLEIIGDNAFAWCGKLNLIELPAKLNEIGIGAFFNCKKLQLEELPKGFTTIGDRAFSHCENLQLAALPEDLTTIGSMAFGGCKKLQLTSLPSGIKKIGNKAFYGCHELNLRELPAHLHKIGKEAFAYCENLQLETLPEGLEIIGEEAFRSTAIRTITIPASVVELGNSAFDTNLIEEINLAQESGLNDGDIERAYGRQLERIQRMAASQRRLQRIITPVELNAEEAEEECPICFSEFNEGEGTVGRLRCGHRMHLDCFENLVRNNFERGVPFKCPICRREYNIF